VAERRPTKIELLELDLDVRMHELWKEAHETENWNLELASAFMRAAYGKGYYDALQEIEDGERGKLGVDNGYRLPGGLKKDG
jgi:hypothetical protein